MGGAFFDPTYNNSKDGYISQLPLGKKIQRTTIQSSNQTLQVYRCCNYFTFKIGIGERNWFGVFYNYASKISWEEKEKGGRTGGERDIVESLLIFFKFRIESYKI